MTPSGEYSPQRLAVAMKEDHRCIPKYQARENFAVLCHISLNMLKQ
jgi:hypothetical protein